MTDEEADFLLIEPQGIEMKAREQEKTKHYKAVKAGSKTIILKEVGVSEGTKKKRLKTN